MVSRHLELEVPLFEAKSAIDLNETLIDLGLKDAFRELTGQDFEYRARILKLLMSSKIDCKESITPAYVA
jgi:serine protease inhibitor